MATAQPKTRAVQVPGEQPQAQDQAQEGQADQTDGESGEVEQPADNAADELAQLRAELAQVRAALSATVRANEAAPKVFDMTKPHQTGKGWFVPESHGTPVKKA